MLALDYQGQRRLLRSYSATINADGTAVNAQDFTSSSGVGGRRLVITASVAGILRVVTGNGAAPADPSAIATVDATGVVVSLAVGIPVEVVVPDGQLITHAKFRGTGTTQLSLALFNF